jgi:hypothetical protein
MHGSVMRLQANAPEREEKLRQMRAAQRAFYLSAVAIGVQPFVELSALIAQYIQLCEQTHKLGGDFTTGAPLTLQKQHGAYLGEKLQSVYGGSLRDCADARQALIFGLMGIDPGALEALDNVEYSPEEQALMETYLGSPEPARARGPARAKHRR